VRSKLKEVRSKLKIEVRSGVRSKLKGVRSKLKVEVN